MKYPSIVLEDIDDITSVDCSLNSVTLKFSTATVFTSMQSAWWSIGKFVMITNHMGDCDVELERGMFLVSSVSFDNRTLIATATSHQTDVSSVVGKESNPCGTAHH